MSDAQLHTQKTQINYKIFKEKQTKLRAQHHQISTKFHFAGVWIFSDAIIIRGLTCFNFSSSRCLLYKTPINRSQFSYRVTFFTQIAHQGLQILFITVYFPFIRESRAWFIFKVFVYAIRLKWLAMIGRVINTMKSYSISDEVVEDSSLSKLKFKLSDFRDSGLPSGLRRLIAKCRSRDGNFGVLRITTGFTSSHWVTFSAGVDSLPSSIWWRKYLTVSCNVLICIVNLIPSTWSNHEKISNQSLMACVRVKIVIDLKVVSFDKCFSSITNWIRLIVLPRFTIILTNTHTNGLKWQFAIKIMQLWFHSLLKNVESAKSRRLFHFESILS